MLRYDQAKVDRIEGSLIILKTDRRPTEARWNSFGIPVWGITHDPFETISNTRADAYTAP